MSANLPAVVQHGPAPSTIAELTEVATWVSKSGMVGQMKPEGVFTLMLIAQAEGRHFIEALVDYHVVEGRPTLRAEKLLSRFLVSGGAVEYLERTPTSVKMRFSHPKGAPAVEVHWTIERARAIVRKGKPLTDGDNWKNYPGNMLTWRCVSEGVAACYPACSKITMTREEAEDGDTITAEPMARGEAAAVAMQSAAAGMREATTREELDQARGAARRVSAHREEALDEVHAVEGERVDLREKVEQLEEAGDHVAAAQLADSIRETERLEREGPGDEALCRMLASEMRAVANKGDEAGYRAWAKRELTVETLDSLSVGQRRDLKTMHTKILADFKERASFEAAAEASTPS